MERKQIGFCHMEVRGVSSMSGAGRDSESRMPSALESWGVELRTFKTYFVASRKSFREDTFAVTSRTRPSVSTAE